MVYAFVDDAMEALLHRINSHTIRERRQIFLSFFLRSFLFCVSC
jgi:hypothetical protein